MESEHRHDFKYCSCRRVAIDGGYDYLRRCFTDGPDDFEDLSIVEEENGWASLGAAKDYIESVPT